MLCTFRCHSDLDEAFGNISAGYFLNIEPLELFDELNLALNCAYFEINFSWIGLGFGNWNRNGLLSFPCSIFAFLYQISIVYFPFSVLTLEIGLISANRCVFYLDLAVA